MERSVVGGKVIDIEAAHKCLYRGKHIAYIHAQLFALLPVYGQVVVGRTGSEEAECLSDGRPFVGLGHKLLHYFFKRVYIIGSISLFYLQVKAHGSAQAGYGRWLYHFYIRIFNTRVVDAFLHHIYDARHLLAFFTTLIPWFQLAIDGAAVGVGGVVHHIQP